MDFKEQTNIEQIGVPLEKNSNNHCILIKLDTMYKSGKEIRLLKEGEKECELIKEGRILL